MKIECIKDHLREVVGQADRITGKNLTLPILRNILLEARNNLLVVKATNVDLGAEFFIPAKVFGGGKAVISGSVLFGFLANLQAEKNVNLELKEGVLIIKSKQSQSSIKTWPHEDFPNVTKVESGKIFKLPSDDLREGLRAVWYSSAVSSMKPELSSVYIYSDDYGLVFVATDSFRLAEKRVKQKKTEEVEGILLPHKNIPEIVKILESINGEVDLFLDKDQVSISHDGFYISSRVIEGTFPDYKQIIPKNTTTEVTLLKEDLTGSLKLANIFSDTFKQVNFKIDPENGKFEIRTKNIDVGENVNRIDTTLSGEPLEINFNYKYIMDCFQSITAESVSLKFNGLSKPMVISGLGDNSFLYLVMPMNR